MSGSDLVKQLQQLADLHGQGALSNAEYAEAKARLLGSRDGNRDEADRPSAALRPQPPTSLDAASASASVDAPRAAVAPPSAPLGRASRLTGTRAFAQDPAEASRPGVSSSGQPRSGRTSGIAATKNPAGAPAPAAPARWTGRSGAVTAIAGGVVVLLSFLVLPMATLPFVGSISGSGVAGESSLFSPFGLLWLVPVEASAIIGLAAAQIILPRNAPGRRARALGVTVVAGTVWTTYIGVLVSLQDQVSELTSKLSISAFLGSGLWFALVAAAVAAVGGLIEMFSKD